MIKFYKESYILNGTDLVFSMKQNAWIPLLIGLIEVYLTNAGPVWPNTFRVDLFETQYSKRFVINENYGAWYYDWTNKRMYHVLVTGVHESSSHNPINYTHRNC